MDAWDKMIAMEAVETAIHTHHDMVEETIVVVIVKNIIGNSHTRSCVRLIRCNFAGKKTRVVLSGAHTILDLKKQLEVCLICYRRRLKLL